MFNPVVETLNLSDASQISANESRAKDCNECLASQIKHPRYKRLPDGRPVVFDFLAQVVAYFFGVDKLGQTTEFLRRNVAEDIFLVGDVMFEPSNVQYDLPGYQGEDHVRRQVKTFDAITNYFIMRAGYKWDSR
jgi:hypothetical protein